MTTLLEAQQDGVRSPGVPFLKSLLAIPWILLLAFGKRYTFRVLECVYPGHIPSSPRGSLKQLVPLLAPLIPPAPLLSDSSFASGCVALPVLMNIKAVIEQRQCTGVWSHKDELPVRLSLHF